MWCAALVVAGLRLQFLREAQRVDGVVLENVGGVPVVQAALPDGVRRVEGSISSSPPALLPGEHVPVYYLPGKADDAQLGSFLELWFAPIILAGIGTPFTLLGTVFTLTVATRGRRERELKSMGERRVAKVTAVESSAVRINRKPAKILVLEARSADGSVQTFRSGALLIDAQAWLGKSVVVYVDRHDPSRYALELVDA